MIDDTEFRIRLSELEGRVPGAAAPEIRRRHGGVPLVGGSIATVLLLAATATTIGAAVIVSGNVRGWPGVENPGQPLEGANLECMTPPQAQAYLTAHGFRNVVWQVEGDGNSSVQMSAPPAHGYVVPGAIIDDGVLLMIVNQQTSGHGVGACYGIPMP